MRNTKKLLCVTVEVLMMAGWARGDAITGYSGPFRVDTRCKEFVIADVKSHYCRGVYGADEDQNDKATFLKGVPANIKFEVTTVDKEIPIERVSVNGKEFEGASFTYDVGTLPLGRNGAMVVIAHGTVNGADVASAPFVVNLDVARLPTGNDWYWEAANGCYKRPEKNPLFLFPALEESLDLSNKALGFAGAGTKKLPIAFNRVPTLSFTEEFDAAKGEYERTASGGGRIGSLKGGTITAEAGGAFRDLWDPHNAAWVEEESGVLLTIKMKDIGWTWYPFSPLIGLYVAVTFFGEEKMELRWNHLEERFYWDGECDPLIGVKGATGMGWRNIQGIGAYLSGGIYAQLSSEKPNILAIDLKAGCEYSDLKHHETEQEIEFYHKRIQLLPTKETKTDVYQREPDPEVWKRMRAQMCRIPVSSPNLVCTPNGSVQVCLGPVGVGTRNANKPEKEQIPVLSIALETGEDMKMEVPWMDGTPDSSPCIAAAASGRLFAVWMNAREAYPDSATADNILSAQEIAVAVRNPDTGEWTARNLTDNGVLDTLPALAVGADGTAFVAWLQNDANEVFSSSGYPSRLYVSRYEGTAWSDPVLVATLDGTSSSFDLATDGRRAVLVWSLDVDGDFSTADDCKLHAVVWDGVAWGTEVAITDGGNGDFLPKVFFETNGLYSVVWNRGGEWVVGEEGALDVATVVPFGEDICPPGAIMLESAGIGKTALLWGEVSNVRCMVLDQGSGEWTAPARVAESEESIRSFGAAFDGEGNLRLATEEAEMTVDEEGRCEYGKSEVVRSVFGKGANPAVFAEDFAFGADEVVDGELMPVVVIVRNLGLEAATNVTVRVWACDGELEEDEEARLELWGEDGEPVVLDLPGGAEVAAEFLWMAEDFRTNLTFVARLEVPEGVGNADTGDDEATWRPGAPSLRLEGGRCEAVGTSTRLLTATVRNAGLAAAEAGTVVSFRLGASDGEEVGRDVAGVVRPGEGHGYDAGMAWEMGGGESWTGSWVTVYAVMATGDASEEVSGAVPIRVMTPKDTDGDGLLDGEEEAMGTDLLKPDTNGDGVSDYDHVYVWFTDPLAGMGGRWTTNTPVRVPFDWLERYPEALEAHGGDHEAFAADTAENGRPVWACYVADLDPTDAASELRVGLVQDEEGNWAPVIVSGESAERRYVFEGAEWMSVEDGEEGARWGEVGAGSRFFRARVEVGGEE